MEQQQRSLIFTASVGLIILAIIVGSIYYLVKFIQSRVSSSRQPVASVETIATVTAPPEAINIDGSPSVPNTAGQGQANPPQSGVNNVPAGKKLYNQGTFQLYYPDSWGMLKCTNSANFELDPTSGSDTQISCSSAVKPITILVNDQSGCGGESLRMGNAEVAKSRQIEGNYIAYRWCTKTDPVLNITHRVSRDGDPATSPNDFSAQIEEFISNLTFTRGS